MPFWFYCPACQSKHVATDEVIEQSVRCPQCKKIIPVPRPLQPQIVSDTDLESLQNRPLGKADIVQAGTPVAVATEPVIDEEPPAPMFEAREREESEMDMTPMVDVTFLLLIFFMVTASFTVQKAMNRPTEATDEPSLVETEEDEDDPDLVQVDIDEFNSYFIIASGTEIEAPSEQDLRIALTDAKSGGTGDAMKLMIRAHVESFHERTVTAMDVGADLDYQMQVQIVEQL